VLGGGRREELLLHLGRGRGGRREPVVRRWAPEGADEALEVAAGGHDEPARLLRLDAIRVRDALRRVGGLARSDDELPPAHAQPHRPIDHVEDLVLVRMDVQRGRVPAARKRGDHGDPVLADRRRDRDRDGGVEEPELPCFDCGWHRGVLSLNSESEYQ
jgi:hypothetical protein